MKSKNHNESGRNRVTYVRRGLNAAEALRYWIVYRNRLKKFKAVASSYAKFHISKEEKKRVRGFWRKHGVPIVNLDWYRLFKSLTGSFDVRFIPEEVFRVVLEKQFNNIEFASRYSDKNYLDFYFKQLRTPEVKLRKIHDQYYDSEFNLLGELDAMGFIQSLEGDFVIKPTVDTGSGRGVKLARTRHGEGLALDETLWSWEGLNSFFGKDFVLQSRLTQSEALAKFHGGSFNTLRVITIRVNNSFEVVCVTFRMGNGSFVDNGHAGGLLCGVDLNSGALTSHAVDVYFRKHYQHPLTKIAFEGEVIPKFSEVKKIALRAHALIPYANVVSFDIGIDAENRPVLVEVNTKGQGIEPHQILKGRPIFGEHTEALLSTCS